MTPTPKVVDKATLLAVQYIANESKNDRPSLGYDIFVRDYLPILGLPPERNESGEIVPRRLDAWIAVAGNPSTPVDVLNQDGTVRFTVPPLVGTIPTYYAPPRGGLSGVCNAAKDKSMQSPAYGQRYLTSALSTALTDQSPYDGSYAESWNAVLVEHGYPPLPGVAVRQASTVETKGVATPTTDLELQDDDFEDL